VIAQEEEGAQVGIASALSGRGILLDDVLRIEAGLAEKLGPLFVSE
jgi:hypothetical protein